jgi:hypothetical protein
MAHFAEINSDNTVIRVIVVDASTEDEGINFIKNDLGLSGRWIQTSYNTLYGVHSGGGIPFRKNYAGVGYTYDEIRDAFIPPKPFHSWKLNENTCDWDPPIPYPPQNGRFRWDENSSTWVEELEK